MIAKSFGMLHPLAGQLKNALKWIDGGDVVSFEIESSDTAVKPGTDLYLSRFQIISKEERGDGRRHIKFFLTP